MAKRANSCPEGVHNVFHPCNLPLLVTMHPHGVETQEDVFLTQVVDGRISLGSTDDTLLLLRRDRGERSDPGRIRDRTNLHENHFAVMKSDDVDFS